jgi:hypothetical protein
MESYLKSDYTPGSEFNMAKDMGMSSYNPNKFGKDKDKFNEIKLGALKHLDVFLSNVSEDKRTAFLKYIIATYNEVQYQWRVKLILAKNLGKYATLFKQEVVYDQFLPMFFRFCHDHVADVSREASESLASIIEKFADDPQKQAAIIKVVKKNFRDITTYKKRQLYAIMCKNVMMNKEIFDKYFKKDFISLIKDKVAVVRVQLAETINHHFLIELNGTYVDD